MIFFLMYLLSTIKSEYYAVIAVYIKREKKRENTIKKKLHVVF